MKYLLFAFAALVLSGCMSSKADRYYLLEVEKPEQKAKISLRSFEMPSYLEQNSLVRRCQKNRIEYIDGHSWASNLRRMLEEALNDGLEQNAERVISMKVRRFEAADDGKFHVKIECFDGGQCKEISFDMPCDAKKPEAIVNAYSQALTILQQRLLAL